MGHLIMCRVCVCVLFVVCDFEVWVATPVRGSTTFVERESDPGAAQGCDGVAPLPAAAHTAAVTGASSTAGSLVCW
jgi:hypothetical protein